MTIAQVQALERAADPLDELINVLTSKPMDRFWRETLTNLARRVGVAEPTVDTLVVCLDKRRRWRYVRNLRNSASIRTARRTLGAPFRRLTGRG